MFVPITEASPFEQHVLLRKLEGLTDHDLLTVDELLVLRYAPNTDNGRPVADALPAHGITTKAPVQTPPEPDAPHPLAPVPAAVPLPMILPSVEVPPPAPGLPSSTLSSEMFLAAARAAIVVEGPSRAEWADPRSRQAAGVGPLDEGGELPFGTVEA